MNFIYYRFLFSVLLFLCSCGNNEEKEKDENSKTEALVEQSSVAKGEIKIVEPVIDEEILVFKKNGITLTEIKCQNNKGAKIALETKKFNEGKNQFKFAVEGIRNYAITYLANNYSLSQFKTDFFEVELMYGNNVFLAFLTDEDNISVKTNKGSVLKSAVLGGVESLFDMEQPHLFYYFPQIETSAPILDFYLVNAAISQEGNKVKVTINETEFLINKWAAYKIGGLKNSENTIRIQLVDKYGDSIDGPFNDSGERQFLLIKHLNNLQ